MNIKIDAEKNELKINITELLQAIEEATDEFDKGEFFRSVSWIPQIREEIIEQLMNAHSGHSYNTQVHEERNALLCAVKEREIEYYADCIAEKIETLKRENEDYWKLYNFYERTVGRVPGAPYTPRTEKIDHDYRKELEIIIEEALSKKLDELRSE